MIFDIYIYTYLFQILSISQYFIMMFQHTQTAEQLKVLSVIFAQTSTTTTGMIRKKSEGVYLSLKIPLIPFP